MPGSDDAGRGRESVAIGGHGAAPSEYPGDGRRQPQTANSFSGKYVDTISRMGAVCAKGDLRNFRNFRKRWANQQAARLRAAEARRTFRTYFR